MTHTPTAGMYPRKTIIQEDTRTQCSMQHYLKSQGMEAASMSIKRGMNKEDVVHIYIQFSITQP